MVKITDLERLLYALGIRQVGQKAGKMLAMHFKTFDAFAAAFFFHEHGKAVGETARNHLHDPIRFHRGVRRDLCNRQVGNGYFAVCIICIN